MSVLSLFQFKQLSEFGNMARAILPVMTDPKISRDEKRKTLRQLTENLSEKTLKNGVVAGQIMEIINMKEDECRKFLNTNVQVNAILSWLPRMECHWGKLAERVKKNRAKYGLKI